MAYNYSRCLTHAAVTLRRQRFICTCISSLLDKAVWSCNVIAKQKQPGAVKKRRGQAK